MHQNCSSPAIAPGQIQGWLDIEQTVGRDICHQIDEKIKEGTVAGVLDLVKVLQFAKDSLNQGKAIAVASAMEIPAF